MARPAKDMAPIYQHLADGWCLKEIADDKGISVASLRTGLGRHRRAIKARSQEQALSMMIARGEVVARG